MQARAAFARPIFLGDREPHAGRDLLGTRKIFVRRLFEIATFERDEALIAAHLRSLVDGHGEMAVTEQLAGRRFVCGDRGGDAVSIETRAGPHLAR